MNSKALTMRLAGLLLLVCVARPVFGQFTTFPAVEIQKDDAKTELLFHDPNTAWYTMGIDASDGSKFKINSGGTVGANTQFVMTPDGSVGIGTNPASKLHVNGAPSGDIALIGSGNQYLYFQSNVAGGYGALGAYDSAAGSSRSLVLQPAGGNVGIGTVTPLGKLDVNGVTVVHNGYRTHLLPTLTGPANGIDSYRYEIGRMGVNQHHWGYYGIITVELYQTYFGAGAYQKWCVKAGYGDVMGSARLIEKIGESQFARISIGTPVLTGSSYAGFANQYIPIYLDAAYYTNWKVRITHSWSVTESLIPEYSQLKIFESPVQTTLAGQIADSSGTPVVLAADGSNVGIGTTSPSHKLTVNGTIRAKEVIVDTGWADYVFAEDYRLAPLSEVEAHIKAHKHLPDMPSAAEVAEKGVSMGEMQAKLLAKLEEVTLHLIRMEKKNAELRREVEALRASH